MTRSRVSVSGELLWFVESGGGYIEARSLMSVNIEPEEELGESNGDPISVFLHYDHVLEHQRFFANNTVRYEDRNGQKQQFSPNDKTTIEIQTSIGSAIDFSIIHQACAALNGGCGGSQGVAGGSFLLEASFCAVPGDHNGDCVVALKDLAIVQAGLDSGFTRADVTEVARNYGFDLSASPDASAAPVPEPSVMLLLLIGITVGSFGWRRRRR